MLYIMFLKKFLTLSIATLAITFNANSQKGGDEVVMTVNGEEITKNEFLQVYLKNNEAPKYDKESLDEYVELYKKFKLKVAEAEALQYDTIPSLKRELKGYKEQLAHPYLVDSSKTKELLQEAYNRMKSEVKAAHILIKLPQDAVPSDTLIAYNKALALKAKIDKGADFGAIAASSSEDPSAKMNKGELGYFTAFQMVYPFETAAYNLEIGEVSMPVRSSFGYHLIKVSDKRPARGTITAAHIMVMTQANDKPEDIANAEKKINEIYVKLQDGESFEKLAKSYSDDQGSKAKGGQLPPFGSGTNQRMVTEFEDAAFALKENGDYSKPFKTDYGFHIVKRIDYKPLGSFEELSSQIKQKLNRGDRANQSEMAFIAKLKEENSFKDKGSKRLTWFYENIDSTVFKKNWEKPELDKNKWMFKYNGEKFEMQSFLDFIAKSKIRKPVPVRNFIDEKYKQWQAAEIMNDEKSRLEDKYPAYKALLQEYHDGVLLYEIMKDKVWDKAIKDTVGLQKFFEANQADYQWTDRIDGIIYSSNKKEMLLEAKLLEDIDSLTMYDILNKVNAESQLNLEADKGKFIQSNNEVLKNRSFNEGANEIFKMGDKYYFVVVNELMPAGPKSLKEARGSVIQAYQEHLEKEWLKELSEKHTINVNQEVLYRIGE
ncbi:peptidylprolyl isomerase [Brumimicrobium aurantiacum]|uniref:Peptidylprolyl isomerase n=2 Tax=Brumimicrobium aurantiacum TaxID=1737063 RepID=A0A3E1EXQ4_9FLAO|nr:peptidylprolyl isomerase [Brumimicrobium aurantiacum]